MATFQITGPDGKKYRVSGETADGAFQALQQHLGNAAPSVDPATNQPPGVPEFSPPGVEGYDPQTGEVTRQPYSKLGSAAHGFADVGAFGFGDELASYPASWMSGRPRDEVLGEIRGLQQEAKEDNPWSFFGGQVGGGIAQGVGIAGGGMSMAANAARAGGGLGRVALGSAADGMIAGALHGAGSGEDAESRALGAAKGAATGTLVGGAAPFAVAAAQHVLSPFVRPIMSRLRPDAYASRAMGDTVRRSGMSTDEIADALARAADDGQGMFNVADAMGHAGQRQLSTVARNPNDMRQTVVDTLTKRQMGQGDRLSQFLAEGFDATDTAAQRATSLTSQRQATANANYGAARNSAGMVDPTAAIQSADDFLMPGASRLMNPGNNIADDSIESAVQRARSYLTDGRSVLTDFNAALRSKQEIDAMIEGAKPAVQRQLIPIRNALDEALEAASPQYAQARDVFRQQSRAIDAIDVGRNATSGRMRSDDTIQQFSRMGADEQAAFRAGYADPLIAKVESTSMSPTTNKARPLMTPKTGEEFPAFAAPGRADQLGSRIAREQRMFETANTALGGSKTADNLADAAEMATFDPGIMGHLFSGRPGRAALDAAGKLLKEAQGMSPGVMERVGKSLLETNPAAVRALLDGGAKTAAEDALRRSLVAMIMGQAGGATGARLGR